MSNPLKLSTVVLPGGRIELSAPELSEGQTVDVLVVPRGNGQPRQSMLELIESPPPSRLTAAEWEEWEKAFQEERNSWDR